MKEVGETVTFKKEKLTPKSTNMKVISEIIYLMEEELSK